MSLEAAVNQAGGRFLGIEQGVVWFTDPETQSTLALPADEVTPENVSLTLLRSRRTFRQEQFRLLIEGLRDHAIFMLDPSGTLSSWNTGAEMLFGYPATEIIGRPVSTLYFSEEQQLERPLRQTEAALRDQRHEEELWMRRRDGSAFWCEMVVRSLRDEQGQHRGFSFVCRDMSRRRQEEQRQHARLCVAQVLAEKFEPSQMLGAFVQCLCRHLDWDLAQYWCVESEGLQIRLEALECPASREEREARGWLPGLRLPGSRIPPLTNPAGFAEPFLVHREQAWWTTIPCLAEIPVETVLLLPLLQHGQIFGLVILAHQRHRDPDRGEMTILEDLVLLLNRALLQYGAEQELQAAGLKLQEQAALMDQVLNTASDLIYMFDREGRYLYLNHQGAAALGLGPDQVIGKTWRELKLNLGLMTRFDQEHLRVMATGVPYRADVTFPTPGELRDFEYIIHPVHTRSGAIDSVVVTCRDVTDRKKTEDRLQMMLDQLPAILWTTDRSLHFTSSLGAGLKAIGLHANEVVGQTMGEFSRGTPFEHATLEAHQKALSGSRITYRSTWKGRVLDIWVQPLCGIDGSITGTVGLALDVTEQSAAESSALEPPHLHPSEPQSGADNHTQRLQELKNLLSMTAAILEDTLARESFPKRTPVENALLHVRQHLQAAQSALNSLPLHTSDDHEAA